MTVPNNPEIYAPLPIDENSVYYRSRLKVYPQGGSELMFAKWPTFTPGNNAEKKKKDSQKKQTVTDGFRHPDVAKDIEEPSPDSSASFDRARRRARARVRDIALSTPFTHFVTLTLAPDQIDRYDPVAIGKRLRVWLDNQVRRKGLTYVLVPERHKDGAIHYHGFFNDSLSYVDSGHTDPQGHPVFNIPEWRFGFTTAIPIYGNYAQAVSYVCKYIGKQGEKIGGRWYYSGGDLKGPEIVYGIAEDWEENTYYSDEQSGKDAHEIYWFEIEQTGNKIGIIRKNMR